MHSPSRAKAAEPEGEQEPEGELQPEHHDNVREVYPVYPAGTRVEYYSTSHSRCSERDKWGQH